MNRRPLRGDRRGLTLIELVLTLTILALAGALVSGALATGLRAWQTGLNSGREELVARIVLERIAAQLRAAVLSPALREGAAAVAFDAAENRLRFVTLAGSGREPAQVGYELQGSGGAAQLVYREYPWPEKEFFGEVRPRREEKLVEITGFAVQVSKRREPPGGGAPAAVDIAAAADWSPPDRELPGSVSVTISVGAAAGPAPRNYQVTVPILTQGVLR